MHSARAAFWVGIILLMGAAAGTFAAEPVTITSPGGDVRAVVHSEQGRVSYRVELGGAAAKSILLDAPLGLRLKGTDFSSLQMVGASAPKQVQDTYVMLTGKKRECRSIATSQTLRFVNDEGAALEMDFRVSDDGVAFRYRVPGGERVRTLHEEVTGFALPQDAKVWCAPADKATMYSPGYETYYVLGQSPGVATNGTGWSFPLLFHSAQAGGWGLITEANLDSSFCATRLSNDPANGVYQIALPDPLEGNAHGSIFPQAQGPWQMPWRVIIVGPTLGTLVESTLVTDVSEPARVSDTSWVKPGRVAWSWWSDNPSPRSAPKQKRFIDLAAAMGWEYVLVDANWTIMNEGNFQDVLNYGKEKNVGVLLWYNSGGPHNVVTEKPRDTLTYDSVRKFEMGLLKEWGVKGIKVDFFQSDKQEVISIYQGILQEAAEKQIMVNFHGCTLPRGWQRTHPHLMSMEAVRGAECYIFDPRYPEMAPVQNTVLPFTRNAVGSMDYTPVTFSNNRYPHLTSHAHELALSVIFESGWLHLADRVEAYLELPDAPKEFLKQVPVTWDETRFVDGFPGEYVVLARRKGETWYVAGINGQTSARELSLKLQTLLPNRAFELTQITDGPDAATFSTATRRMSSANPLSISLKPRGGFVMVLKPM